MMVDLKVREQVILSGLKDFQLATVNRVDYLFRNGFKRVLVADEVGLGKTLVAKGVIAKMARFYKESSEKELLKVVYICSNQSIAGQNLKKLKVHDGVKVDGLSDTRLSMQHLKIYEQMNEPEIKNGFVQLIPLTPGTSFSMTGGCGSVMERALIFAILKRIPFFHCYLDELNELMMSYATVSWHGWKKYFDEKVDECDYKSNGDYLITVSERVVKKLEDDPGIMALAEEVFASIKSVGYKAAPDANYLILRFRKLMAEISVEMLDADLVIMDEFQRFPELIRNDEDSETALLARKFFNPDNNTINHPCILLLSATPYKLYSTMEEIQENNKDEHYKEFMQVIGFLFEHRQKQYVRFSTAWNNYSVMLKEFSFNDRAAIIAQKRQAEDSIYKGVCRTERMKVPGSADLIDMEMQKNKLELHEDDILSYVEVDKVMAETEMSGTVPVEYIKSAPLLMSFMQNYKLKQKITEKMKSQPTKLSLLKSRRLWVNQNILANYMPINVNHARLKKLQEYALPKGAEKLMWIPPARPYYDLGGPFKNQTGFSKTLVFSAWEMVPRAIAALLSYEAERLNVGELVSKTSNEGKENRSYFAEKRFPAPRIKFNIKNNMPDNMNLLCLLYPSFTLASLYDPVAYMNRNASLKEIQSSIQNQVKERLDNFKVHISKKGQRRDERWYFMAPLLMDQQEPQMESWFHNPILRNIAEDQDGVDSQDEDKRAISQHLDYLKSLYFEPEQLTLGPMPKDLEKVLVAMAIGSPAVCALRMLGKDVVGAADLALQLAKTIVDRFNNQEAIAMVDLSYGKPGEGVHWKSVLQYCRDGNLQAVLDEYAHMLLEGYDHEQSDKKERNNFLISEMIKTLKTHTASYNVDTFKNFSEHVKNTDKKNRKNRFIRMRSSYAVGFYDTKSEGKSIQRKDNIRLSFNSPFRPFVLATTSIGQEGLDFHYYCRQIVHWNLPANPIDIEQREGRINRYKCHAIRQNIAHKYGKTKIDSEIWSEIFAAAEKQEKNLETSDLIPFWCLAEQEQDGLVYKIQRIVPIYPMSRDSAKYERLMKILSLYRLSLGQARQEELIEYLFENEFDEIDELFMNLSPYFKEHEKKLKNDEL